MNVCDPDADLTTLQKFVTNKTGVDLKLTRPQLCKAYTDIKNEQWVLPPMMLSKDRTWLVDKKSPLSAAEYQLLLKTSTKANKVKSLAKRIGAAIPEGRVSKQTMIESIYAKLKSMDILEPIQLAVTRKRVAKIVKNANSVLNGPNGNNAPPVNNNANRPANNNATDQLTTTLTDQPIMHRRPTTTLTDQPTTTLRLTTALTDQPIMHRRPTTTLRLRPITKLRLRLLTTTFYRKRRRASSTLFSDHPITTLRNRLSEPRFKLLKEKIIEKAQEKAQFAEKIAEGKRRSEMHSTINSMPFLTSRRKQ